MEEAPIKVGMRPSSPGEFIREEVLDELGLSVVRAAELLGVRRATLSDLVNGKAGLSPEMALRLEKAFGISMDTLLRMQACHDSYTMRRRADQIDVKRFVPREGPRCAQALGRGPGSTDIGDVQGDAMMTRLARN